MKDKNDVLNIELINSEFFNFKHPNEDINLYIAKIDWIIYGFIGLISIDVNEVYYNIKQGTDEILEPEPEKKNLKGFYYNKDIVTF